MTIVADMDSVLADFDRHYIETMGPLPDRSNPANDVDWAKISGMDFSSEFRPWPAMELDPAG